MLAFMLLVWGMGMSQTEFTGEMFQSKYEISNKDFRMFPNPIKDALTIVLPTNRSDLKVTIFSGVGSVLYEELLDPIKKNNIDFSTYASGIYFVEISSESSKITKRMVKE